MDKNSSQSHLKLTECRRTLLSLTTSWLSSPRLACLCSHTDCCGVKLCHAFGGCGISTKVQRKWMFSFCIARVKHPGKTYSWKLSDLDSHFGPEHTTLCGKQNLILVAWIKKKKSSLVQLWKALFVDGNGNGETLTIGSHSTLLGSVEPSRAIWRSQTKNLKSEWLIRSQRFDSTATGTRNTAQCFSQDQYGCIAFWVINYEP